MSELYGNWQLIEKSSASFWKCKCLLCEKVCDVNRYNLQRGGTKSCGCQTNAKSNIEVGARFNLLSVISEVKLKNKGRFFLVKCECGNETTVELSKLKTGHTKSCGAFIHYKNHHGDTGSRLHACWENMRHRCNDKTDENYGGRGITVCPEWDKSYLKFKEDMIGEYSDELTIDRIDVNGHYCKENCRWTTVTVQLHNRRKMKNKSSSFIGVSWVRKDSRWLVQIRDSTRNFFLKVDYISDEKYAGLLYDELSQIVFGDRPNQTTKSLIVEKKAYDCIRKKCPNFSIDNCNLFVVNSPSVDTTTDNPA